MRSVRFFHPAACFLTILTVLAMTGSAWSFTDDHEVMTFSDLVQSRPGGVIGIRAIAHSDLPATEGLREGWDAFITEQNGGWKVWIDTRSGLPMLVSGRGIAWSPVSGNGLKDGPEPTLENLARLASDFLDENRLLLGDWTGQLVLDHEASALLGGRVMRIVFKQTIDDVPVEGSRYEFHVSLGNLVAFGTSRWAEVRTDPQPDLTQSEARAVLDRYLGIESAGGVVILDEGSLHMIPTDPALSAGQEWEGGLGQGYDHRLVWRFSFQVPNEPATWVGEVDAHTGKIFSFFDDTRYERVKGYVNPLTDDGNCASGGCPEPDYPMPFVDIAEDGGADTYTGDFGLYECTMGATEETNLIGPYFRVSDKCGAISESAVCDEELDLGPASGINCDVAVGASPGNTNAARTGYYNLNRVAQKARFWMPDNTWIRGQVTFNSNVNSTCNATWSGQLNMYRAGNGCGNTGQNQGVLVHEWGHGMDQNDGGGYDNPSEAYADVVAIFEGRISCVGPGFRPAVMCSGYGDTCLDCTGIRDMDWDARTAHTPATPSGFLTSNCSGGGGPCGKETHCASYVPSEAIYDLAARDLVAMGLDTDTAWQLAERLFYASRPGSGGDVYNCSLPSSDSCSVGSWYHQLRVMDDDDGNLDNGTPHAAAIFAAFDRHDIACGNSGDANNQNSSTCPTLAAPVVTSRALTNEVELTWDPVPDAAAYRIYRNETGCIRSQFPVGEVAAPETIFVYIDLANEFTVYYRVVAIGSNTACESPVSTCLETAAQPLAGKVRFNQATYGCNNRIGMKVVDANHPGATMTVTLWSDTETTPESVVLNETSPGSGKYLGEIYTTSDPASSDGLISTTNGDTITAEYIDLDNGAGGTNEVRLTSALSDCVFPVIFNVNEAGVTDTAATVTWETNEDSDTVLSWGETTPPENAESGPGNTTVHSVNLSGLSECTVYYYEAQSTDPAGNLARDDNGGTWYRFETLGDFGEGLQPCHAGKVTVLDSVYSCNDLVGLKLVDMDLNEDPLTAETVTILITSTTETDSEIVPLTETGVNTSIFTGSIGTDPGAPAPDGLIQTRDGDVLTATYEDLDDGAGYPALSFDTGMLDCNGPAISSLSVSSLTNARATVIFVTDEPANSVVEWGLTPALGEVVSSGNTVTNHSTLLNRFTTCTEVYFRVKSTDTHGNMVVTDDNGAPFKFHTYEIPGLYALEDFEDGGASWELGGEWEIDAPQGIGGSTGNADPASAYNNETVLGHDLTGLGAYPGDYEPGTNETARSPHNDASTWTNTKLIYYRYLNNGTDDNGSLWLWTNGVGRPVFLDQSDSNTANSFEKIVLDISPFADGAGDVFLEFKQTSGTSGQYSGWNIDDLIFKDGSLPDYASCGGCGQSPSFAGAVSAMDNNACGADGVTISWKRAAAWGTGQTGTYSVYRDITPGFTPSAGNRIATGLTTLSYNDISAPADQTLYYLVRAENDETCAAGPNNSGVTDSNTAYMAVSESSSQPVPGEIDTLRVDLVGMVNVRLDWDAVAAATSFRIYRSTSPLPETFGLYSETDRTLFEDIGEGANANTYYYKVTALNACGVEGP